MALTGKTGLLLGPLTTSWSMPASCSVHFVNCATCTEGYRGQHCVSNGGTGPVEDDMSCWPPPSVNQALLRKHPFQGLGFYSPGLACPTGYTTACTAEYGRRPQWDIQFALVPGETAVGCCPEGFQCANQNGNTCIAIISSGTQTIVPTAMCSGAQVVSSAQATLPAVVFPKLTSDATTDTAATHTITVDVPRPTTVIAARTVTVPVPVREMILLAPMFQLNYQSSDLASSTTTTSSTNASPTTSNQRVTDATTSSTSSPPSDTLAASTGQSGLSTGAMVGVGVGAALGGLLLGIAAILLFLRHRRRKTSTRAAELDAAWTGPPQAEYKYTPYPVEAPVHVVTEMSADPERYEACGGHTPVELAAGGGRQSHGRSPNHG